MKELKQAFQEQLGKDEPVDLFFAPGRVNLIGEHTDYNGGHVFPCALSVGTYAAAQKREDTTIRLYSMNFPDLGVIETDLDYLKYRDEDDWANYPKGVIKTFRTAGYEISSGMDIAFYGNIPNGAGLSSSASIELVTSVVLKELFQLSVDPVEMVKLSQQAENEFVGVNCGIMDQFAIGMGKKDHAILLNCDSLEYQHTPIDLTDHALIIANTNKRRGLADSKYNERREQCEEALKDLQRKLSIHSLGDLTKAEFEDHKHLIEDTLAQKRAKHAVYENRRTMEAVEKLNAGDIEGFGQLMNESHVSLRDDYEVTGKELDALVEAAWQEDAVGSRMTGAGFGGCTISIVNRNQVEAFMDNVGRKYSEQTGLEADFYKVEIGDGAKKLKEVHK
ncbi:galactokinase [Halobacillus halophilus]|uniref:Galactokinase n=1 Tax=Halobacillus halophilus (strain ATCC 35676 / DSM 2266 / JCM 20832 / KCTC 3685 / LMG 17431 / NBRC 102448 / NCIMB 2269) TaxID=866895 RepID=I0JRV2_HALH3|nr:galactokinase [Halobacillus halophilus]ASF40825.1 galactokinase [Halobacillus halophilus]CCG46873.1 galactokinase [Halobacillus halophilus DSM 2266]